MAVVTAAALSALHNGADVSRLTALDVSGKEVERMPGVDACPRLKKLDMSSNLFTSLRDLSSSSFLEWLNASNNRLADITGLGDGDTKLKVLNMSHNQMSGAVDVSPLTALRALILSHNTLSAVAGLENIQNLNTLILSHNCIEEIPVRTFKRALHLTKLGLSHNKLRSLRGVIRKCYGLKELRVSHNRLSELPEDMASLGSLRILDAGGNRFKKWEDIAVLGKLHVENVTLKGCPLCEEEDYEEKLCALMPDVRTIDGKRLEGVSKKRYRKEERPGGKPLWAETAAMSRSKRNGVAAEGEETEARTTTSGKGGGGGGGRVKHSEDARRLPDREDEDDEDALNFKDIVATTSGAELRHVGVVKVEFTERKRYNKREHANAGRKRGGKNLADNASSSLGLRVIKKTSEIGKGGSSAWDDDEDDGIKKPPRKKDRQGLGSSRPKLQYIGKPMPQAQRNKAPDEEKQQRIVERGGPEKTDIKVVAVPQSSLPKRWRLKSKKT